MTIMCRNSRPNDLSYWCPCNDNESNNIKYDTSEEYIRKSKSNHLFFEISSYLPAIKIDSWENLRCLLYTEHFQTIGTDWVFRGQSNHKWMLESTLERLNIRSLELREKHLNLFKKECRRPFKDSMNLMEIEANELWAIGQHYGLSTPLLDWTTSPYIALFFAFEKTLEEKCTTTYHSIFALNRTLLTKYLPDLSNVLFFDAEFDPFGRLINQSGLFTITPDCSSFEDTIIDELRNIGITNTQDIAKFICKIYIKSTPKERKCCLEHLQHMNIHYGTLFPDLMGAAKYCNQVTKSNYGVDC